VADPIQYGDMTLELGGSLAEDELSRTMIEELAARVNSIVDEQQRFRLLCDRFDALYYPPDITEGGSDIWPNDPGRRIPGRTHVSVNPAAAYVDIPASLQAVPPIENMLATDDTDSARDAAAQFERIYVAWKADQSYDLKRHKACTVKGLYGRTASKVYWDRETEKVCIEVVEQPRNLYMGYKADTYEKLEWAAYVIRMDPNAVREAFGVNVEARSSSGSVVPFTLFGDDTVSAARSWLNFGPAKIEVWDYWYRRAAPRQSASDRTRMETWNVIIAGNLVVRGPVKYSEYKGAIPFRPLFNTFIPGAPDGRSDLYDVEPLLREKTELITAGSQMIRSGVAGDFWQLIGENAPPAGKIKPERNQVVYPGPGNRIEAITPFIAQFQFEQFLGRIDREGYVITGLNEMLIGLAPVQALNSSKAINALVSQFETRIALRRQLQYEWMRGNWSLASTIMAAKNPTVRAVIKAGAGRLDIQDPSLSPRDEFETAQRAAALVNAKLWSQRRGMDAVHVDDPETEQDMIREERTDATMFPADVQVMAQLMAALQSLGLQAPQAAQAQAQQQLGRGQNDLATALGGATMGQTNGAPGMAAGMDQVPPEALTPGATPPGGAPAPFAQGPGPAAPQIGLAQTMIKEGKASSRILTQQQLGRR
jgi:hypothetical protein